MNYRHGKKRSRVYSIWCGIVARCTNPNAPAYDHYGGRGIGISDEWRSFGAFYADMGDGAPDLTVERTNNDLGYCRENCRWATRTEQGRNKSNNRLLTVDGETLPVSVWAERSGLKASTIYARVAKGWPHDAAVKEPLITARKGVSRGSKLFGAQHGVAFSDEQQSEAA